MIAWQSWFRRNINFCLLFAHHLLRWWHTVFSHVILNFAIWYLWRYYRPVDRELSRYFPVDPSRGQRSWAHMKQINWAAQHTHMPLSTTNKSAYQHNSIIKVAYYFHFAGKKLIIKYHELSLIVMSAAHTKGFWYFCEYNP